MEGERDRKREDEVRVRRFGEGDTVVAMSGGGRDNRVERGMLGRCRERGSGDGRVGWVGVGGEAEAEAQLFDTRVMRVMEVD